MKWCSVELISDTRENTMRGVLYSRRPVPCTMYPLPGLDFYGCVKLVNYVRMEVKASEAAARGDRKAAASEISRALLSSMGAVLADER